MAADTVSTGPCGTRLNGDQGAVFAEFVLVLPMLITVLMGVFEFGMAWRVRNDLQSALRVGLRIDANSGNNPLADWNTVLALQANLTRVPNLQIDYLIVFKGSVTPGTTTTVPAACLTAAEGLVAATATATGQYGVSGSCNIFTRKMIAGTTSTPVGAPAYNCTANDAPSSAWDGKWCPKGRQTGMDANATNGPDAIGLYARYRYSTYSRLIGTSITLTDSAVGRLEPR
jgi:Flp pilus assembly protein TadG